MAGRKKDRRVEPSFGGGKRNDEWRVSADDRSVPTSRRSRGKGNGGGGRSGRGSRKSGGRRGRGGGGPLRLLTRLIYWCCVLALWIVICAGGVVAYYGMQLPAASEWKIPDRPPNVQIVSLDGTLIGNRGDTGGEAVKIKDLPSYVPNAVIAIEDRRFRSHFGLDPIGLARAFATNAMRGHLRQGGSTLTQQLAKNMFLSPERSLKRKVQEVVLALWLEHHYSKDQILEMYLNRVYLGGGAYGIDAAAHRYFDEDARHLTIPQAAMIAGLLKGPSYYSPMRNLKRARTRAALVVNAMAEEKYISQAQAKQALAQPAQIATAHLAKSENYVADWVMDQIPGYIGNISGDIVVQTTIDMTLQRAAEKALVDGIDKEGKKYNVSQAALVSMDGTGAVRALVGGKDYSESQFDRAIQAHRQPGSTFKPFVYLTALEHGLRPDSIRIDQPVTFGNWSPHNDDNKYIGPVTLKTALARSINTIAAQLVMEVGPANVIETAHRLGINSAIQPNASIALGTSEVTLLELTGAYVPFANGGYGATAHVIQSIKSSVGKVLYSRKEGNQPQVVSIDNVAMMNDMLQETIESGTAARRATLSGWPAAGKTGTSQDFRDGWFVGYTANLTTGVWVGNDDNTPTKRAFGGTMPADIWSAYMKPAHAGVPVRLLPGTDLLPSLMARQDQTEAPQTASNDQDALTQQVEQALQDSQGREPPPPGTMMPGQQPQRRRGLVDLIFGR
ncbi:penicillin-binding protein 1A [Faunimonas pinastri]|uniref:Penicillin-binding protein 1A n=1 Tax=Faunimonas pinastri TaxID=1855383 RepID=A0A1H9PUQ4_9HYPH|nr:transglycosylase domain-containing protein [Faunimonas pinastri]SER51343.1 penicillin-binding protein 1A [Faunimonas pinastri]